MALASTGTPWAPPSRDRPRRVTVLGSTGSVGTSTIDLIQANPDLFRVEALTAHRNAALLAHQARAVRAAVAVIADESQYGTLCAALEGSGVEAACGEAALLDAASRPADWVMVAIVGATGLAPTLRAVRQGALVAFANKETLVCAGPLMMSEVEASGAVLLPVDSEHNAIFQVLDEAGADGARPGVDRVILTASGGPFRSYTREQMAAVTPDQAVAHPNWSMGAKISVDSATMMNKGLEIIEASYLFGLPEAQIDVVVHPQSIVHSLVEYIDGSMLAQLGAPDMRTPIAHTLSWPARMDTTGARLSLLDHPTLQFEPPDPARFPALRLARSALTAGGSAPTVLNAANEEAVAAFLSGRIRFLDIERVVEATLTALPATPLESLDAVYDMDARARVSARDRLAKVA